MLNIQIIKNFMQTIKHFMNYAAVLMGFAAFAFFAPSCSDKEDDKSETVKVSGVSVTPDAATIRVGKTQTLSVLVRPTNATDRTYTLTSSNPAVASVEKNTVTGVSVGDAVITATTNDGSFTATCNITVENEPEEKVVELNNFTKGVMVFAGTNYGDNGQSYNWLIRLGGDSYDIVNLKGKGDALMFEVNTDRASKTTIPSGTYKMIAPEEAEVENLLPFTVVPGLIDDSDGTSPIGTWYLFSDVEGGDPNATNAIDAGSVVINSTGDTYTMEFEFVDTEEKTTFKGTYLGSLIYLDITAQ